jgi:hypothetical protein
MRALFNHANSVSSRGSVFRVSRKVRGRRKGMWGSGIDGCVKRHKAA